MASTLIGDVFVPEIATMVATAEFPNRLALGFAGAPFVTSFPPETLLVKGQDVKFPRWNPLGEFADLTEDVAMTPEKLDSSLDTATVIVGGKAAEITDWAALGAADDPSAEVGRQMATLAARYVDQKLIDKAETTPLVETVAAIMGWDNFIDAITTHWGDKAYDQIGGIVVHSKVAGDLAKDDDFKAADTIGAPGSLLTGFVGRLGLYPVFVSDRITGGATFDNLILKRGALGLKFQRTLLVETDRDVLKKNDVIAGDVRISVHQLFGEPRTVIKFNTQ